MGGRRLAAGALLLTAACCCLAVLGGGWSHAGVASDTDVTAGGGVDRHVALVVRTQRIHDPTAKAKQLETQAHKQAALARLEAKTVKSLTAELSHLTAPTAISHTNSRLQTAHAPAPAAHAPAPAASNRQLPGPTWRALARHSLHEIERKLEAQAREKAEARLERLNTGASDMDNGQRAKGAGYWDKEHHDDHWESVATMQGRLAKRKAKWAAEERDNEHVKDADAFVDEAAAEAPVVNSANAILQLNEAEPELSSDDVFVSPPAALTPSHRLPVQSDVPWESKVATLASDLWSFSR